MGIRCMSENKLNIDCQKDFILCQSRLRKFEMKNGIKTKLCELERSELIPELWRDSENCNTQVAAGWRMKAA